MPPTTRSTRTGACLAPAVLLGLLLAIPPAAWAQESLFAQQVVELLGVRDRGQTVTIAGRPVYSADVQRQLYRLNDYEPLWDDAAVRALARAIDRLAEDGLSPSEFRFPEIASQFERPRLSGLIPRDAVVVDVLLSEAFLRAAYQLYFGKVDPKRVDPDINFLRADPRDVAVPRLLQAIRSGAVEATLTRARPGNPAYGRMKAALHRYRGYEAAGGWERIAPGPTLRLGDVDDRVGTLRTRLAVTGDLPSRPAPFGDGGEGEQDTSAEARVAPLGGAAPTQAAGPAASADAPGAAAAPAPADAPGAAAAPAPADASGAADTPGPVEVAGAGGRQAGIEAAPAPDRAPAAVYDEVLEAAVRRFQRRQGLRVDGLVGPSTLAALNVPVTARIDQIRVNLERLRWILHEARDEYLVVDIAAFQFYWVVDSQLVWRSDVQVGREYTQTPVFAGRMSYLVFNPTWTIPPGILRRTVIPGLRRDPQYLQKNGYLLLTQDGERVDPSTVDFETLEGFPFVVRQPAGPDNALGRVKFMFPNPHFVFLHDTNHRELFDRAVRMFSSGCIRLRDPLVLAERLLARQGWRRERMEAVLASGKTTRVVLEEPMRIFVTYFTARLPPEEAQVHFREDIYGRDPPVLEALDGDFTPRRLDE